MVCGFYRYVHYGQLRWSIINIPLFFSIGTKRVAFPIIRHCECMTLVPKRATTDRCVKCCSYCNVLRTLLSHDKQKHTSAERTHSSSHTPYQSLLTSEKVTGMHRLHSLQHNTHKQSEHLKGKLATAVEKNDSPVDGHMHLPLWQHSLHTLSLGCVTLPSQQTL